jgi:hypothetical protein
LEKSDFFGLFWVFSKNDFLMHFNTLTKNAVEPFKQKQKYFFSKGKKDNLTVFIFGHFKNVHFQKLTPNVFQREREKSL